MHNVVHISQVMHLFDLNKREMLSHVAIAGRPTFDVRPEPHQTPRNSRDGGGRGHACHSEVYIGIRVRWQQLLTHQSLIAKKEERSCFNVYIPLVCVVSKKGKSHIIYPLYVPVVLERVLLSLEYNF